MASNGTDVSWPYALCNDDPSSFLASSWRTSSTTNDLILLNAPFVDPDDTDFSTHTTDVLTATFRPRQPDTSTTHTHPEIAETYVITGRKSSNSRRLHLSSHRNPTSGTMETWCRFSWLQQGEWFGFPFQNSPKPILQLQRHWRNGSFASPTLEVLVPRITQYMAPSYCLRQRNLRTSLRQHRHYSICGWIGSATTNSACRLGQVSHFQVTLYWPICEPKRGHSNYGKRSCSVASILASSSTVCRRGQPTAHSWIRSWKRTMDRHHLPHLKVMDLLQHPLEEHYKDNHRLQHPLTLRLYWSLRDLSIHGLWTTNLPRWLRPNTRSGWKTWNSLNTNKILWKSIWKKSRNGGETNLMMRPKPSREQVWRWALTLANTKAQPQMRLSSRSWR